MSKITDIAVLEIKPEQAPALYVTNGLDAYLEQIRQSVNEVPDLSTTKGRTRVASLAAQVSRSKTAIEKPGREYLKRLKEAVKPAEAEIKRFVDECDRLRDETRRPLTEWEAEQDRIKAEEQMNAWHAEALIMNENIDLQRAIEFESDHEIALLLNEKFDRDAAEAAAEAERKRIAHEEELKRQAAEQARQEAEAAAQRERDAAARREAELKAAAENAERLRLEAEQRAEREKQEAVEAANRKAQEEAERVKRVAEQKEAIRLAEEKRVADEAAKRAADVEHRKAINNQALAGFVAAGLSEESAKLAVMAIARNAIPAVRITY